jgi:hypothetical protein
MDGRFVRTAVIGAAQPLPINRHHLTVGSPKDRLNPTHKTRLKLEGGQTPKHTSERVMGGDTIGQV